MAKDWTQEAAFELLETENARLRAALEQVLAQDDQPACCGKGIWGQDGPECCGQPEYGIDRAQNIARAALDAQPAPGKEEA